MHLYLAHQGGTLRLRQGRLLLEGEEGPIASFPARQVRGVALFGNVRLSTPALDNFPQSMIYIIFCCGC
jgi:CRISPR-associated protein Cas1